MFSWGVADSAVGGRQCSGEGRFCCCTDPSLSSAPVTYVALISGTSLSYSDMARWLPALVTVGIK